ncbi:unnamed protein product [Amoebophrya sp. A120]|nr:unnamed protein product [Amoebophrya sp. A120]|eukprot:GSA120T00003626001.1
MVLTLAGRRTLPGLVVLGHAVDHNLLALKRLRGADEFLADIEKDVGLVEIHNSMSLLARGREKRKRFWKAVDGTCAVDATKLTADQEPIYALASALPNVANFTAAVGDTVSTEFTALFDALDTNQKATANNSAQELHDVLKIKRDCEAAEDDTTCTSATSCAFTAAADSSGEQTNTTSPATGAQGTCTVDVTKATVTDNMKTIFALIANSTIDLTDVMKDIGTGDNGGAGNGTATGVIDLVDLESAYQTATSGGADVVAALKTYLETVLGVAGAADSEVLKAAFVAATGLPSTQQLEDAAKDLADALLADSSDSNAVVAAYGTFTQAATTTAPPVVNPASELTAEINNVIDVAVAANTVAALTVASFQTLLEAKGIATGDAETAATAILAAVQAASPDQNAIDTAIADAVAKLPSEQPSPSVNYSEIARDLEQAMVTVLAPGNPAEGAFKQAMKAVWASVQLDDAHSDMIAEMLWMQATDADNAQPPAIVALPATIWIAMLKNAGQDVAAKEAILKPLLSAAGMNGVDAVAGPIAAADPLAQGQAFQASLEPVYRHLQMANPTPEMAAGLLVGGVMQAIHGTDAVSDLTAVFAGANIAQGTESDDVKKGEIKTALIDALQLAFPNANATDLAFPASAVAFGEAIATQFYESTPDWSAALAESAKMHQMDTLVKLNLAASSADVRAGIQDAVGVAGDEVPTPALEDVKNTLLTAVPSSVDRFTTPPSADVQTLIAAADTLAADYLDVSDDASLLSKLQAFLNAVTAAVTASTGGTSFLQMKDLSETVKTSINTIYDNLAEDIKNQFSVDDLYAAVKLKSACESATTQDACEETKCAFEPATSSSTTPKPTDPETADGEGSGEKTESGNSMLIVIIVVVAVVAVVGGLAAFFLCRGGGKPGGAAPAAKAPAGGGAAAARTSARKSAAAAATAAAPAEKKSQGGAAGKASVAGEAPKAEEAKADAEAPKEAAAAAPEDAKPAEEKPAEDEGPKHLADLKRDQGDDDDDDDEDEDE